MISKSKYEQLLQKDNNYESLKSQSNSSNKYFITQKDDSSDHQLRQLKRKIGIMKEGLLNERKQTKQVEQKLHNCGQKLKKVEQQNKKRDEKNEVLLLEIRVLKDALIQQRNQKQKYLLQLKQKEQQQKKDASSQGKSSMGNMFGFSSFFKK